MIATEPSAVTALIERSHRLGADLRNTNYACGNASAKDAATDPPTGKHVDLPWGEELPVVIEVSAYYPRPVTYHPTCHSLRLLRMGDRSVRLPRAAETGTLVLNHGPGEAAGRSP